MFDYSLINTLRKKKKLTIEQLSERVGVSKSYLCEIEKGKKSISAENLFSLCKILNVSMYDFFEQRSEEATIATQMIEVWNEVCTKLKKVRTTVKNREREKKLNALIGNRDYLSKDGSPLFERLNDWRAYCVDVNNIPFLCGDNSRKWVADIDFCIRDKKTGGIKAILEGKYNTIRNFANNEQHK